ncbi:hypothetical protein ACIBG8_53410 [Nonomuraea sp. NPDC050556]|uniref:hypothetical protein n=1 Tax=Nonomuraea sp. NPDC050556 TaxID=3364369 RepID=UPI0037AF1B45
MMIRNVLITGALAALVLTGSAAATATTKAEANSRHVCLAYVHLIKARQAYEGTDGDIAGRYNRLSTMFQALSDVASENSALAGLTAKGHTVARKALRVAATTTDYDDLQPYEKQLKAIDRKIRTYCS